MKAGHVLDKRFSSSLTLHLQARGLSRDMPGTGTQSGIPGSSEIPHLPILKRVPADRGTR
jgi:hypothetical protein